MLGTIVNTAAIIVGTAIGAAAKRGIPERYKGATFAALGLATVLLGVNAAVSYMPRSAYPVLFIVSLVVGGLTGTALDLNGRVDRALASHGGKSLATGLTTGVLLYCIGTLSIVGPMMSALKGDNTFLFTNATLDFVSSIVLSASYGLGMLWAAPVLFLWQGGIYALSAWLGQGLISEALLADLSIVGGALILCSGLSILKIKEIRTIDLLPALLVPPLWHALGSIF